MRRLQANTVPFYIRNLSVHRFWRLRGSWKQSRMDTEEQLYLNPGLRVRSWQNPIKDSRDSTYCLPPAWN